MQKDSLVGKDTNDCKMHSTCTKMQICDVFCLNKKSHPFKKGFSCNFRDDFQKCFR